jgi:hypothetical protein
MASAYSRAASIMSRSLSDLMESISRIWFARTWRRRHARVGIGKIVLTSSMSTGARLLPHRKCRIIRHLSILWPSNTCDQLGHLTHVVGLFDGLSDDQFLHQFLLVLVFVLEN